MELKPTMHMIGCDWLLDGTQNVWLTDSLSYKCLSCFQTEKFPDGHRYTTIATKDIIVTIYFISGWRF